MSHNSFSVQKIQYPELGSVGISVVYQFLKVAGTERAATRNSLDKIMPAEIQLLLLEHVSNGCESRTFLLSKYSHSWQSSLRFDYELLR